MSQVNFITASGEQVKVDADAEYSLMQLAVDNEVPGIDGDCGGSCSCATCHVYVAPDWADKVGSPSKEEEALLTLNPDRKDNSRLCCQLQASEELDGITVEIPEFQF